MKPFYYLSFFVLAILLAGTVSAQVSQGGTPLSFGKLSLSSTIDTKTMDALDIDGLLREDSVEALDPDIPFRFGYGFDVEYNLYNSGTWEDLPDGGRLWRLRIKAPGAYSINLIYSQYYMPEGATFFVYNEDHSTVRGAFTDYNNKEHGMFSTAPTKGDVTILEYYEPASVKGFGAIEVDRVVHGYKDIFFNKSDKGFGSSGSCNNNVNCPVGEDWKVDKRGVTMILTSGGSRICSGSIVNNVREDRTPFFLTANHCLGGETTWMFMFNYESPSCSNIDGPTNQTLSGSTRLANYSTSDFALLQLSVPVPDSYNPYYEGWSAVDVAPTSQVGIHHPSGDIKKISFDYDPATSTDYLASSGTSHWRIGSWDDGTTEPGSSGSPLFDQNHHVIGQLHGGYASCTSLTSDWYGKFAMSWLGGGTNATQLKHWLDPDNTGTTVLDGFDPFAGVIITTTPLENTRDTTDDYSVVAEITSYTDLAPASLYLHYEISAVQYNVLLSSIGSDQYEGFIPAQSAGTAILYWLTGSDIDGNADTTDVYGFFVDFTPVINVDPAGTMVETVASGTTADADMIISNAGNGILDYSISVLPLLNKSGLLYDLYSNDALQPANFFYDDPRFDYDDVKGSDAHPDGYPVEKDAGGPDGFGYFWVDSDEPGGPQFNWIDISSTGVDATYSLDDDNYNGPWPLGGFSFPYYGNYYTEYYIASNGMIGFDSTNLKSRQKTPLPSVGTPNNMIAWFWDDLDFGNGNNPGSAVYYEFRTDSLIIMFKDLAEYAADPGDIINAEVILEVDGTITIQYLSVAPGFDVSNCAIGIENEDGTDGLQVCYLTPYVKDSLVVQFFMPYPWLTLSQAVGSVGEGEADTIGCTFDPGDLEAGVYNSNIIISSNDPEPGASPLTIGAEMTVTSGPTYLCGDANGDEAANVGDVVYIINYVFKEGPAPDPMEAGDANCDGTVNVGDGVYIINYAFNGGPAPCASCP